MTPYPLQQLELLRERLKHDYTTGMTLVAGLQAVSDDPSERSEFCDALFSFLNLDRRQAEAFTSRIVEDIEGKIALLADIEERIEELDETIAFLQEGHSYAFPNTTDNLEDPA